MADCNEAPAFGPPRQHGEIDRTAHRKAVTRTCDAPDCAGQLWLVRAPPPFQDTPIGSYSAWTMFKRL